MDKFEEFKNKEKFIPDSAIFYAGIAEPALRPVLTQIVNQAADDFREVFSTVSPTDAGYQQKISAGLKRLDGIYLDTEDKERLCHYFEELMEMVGLKSSAGILNEFLYGFDPRKPEK